MANEIKILGESIPLSHEEILIDSLKFLKDNPRVYECTRQTPGFNDKTEEEQQDIIYRELQKQPGFKDLTRDIQQHEGLLEPILVRHDTMEVIEGNSRLAVYRDLYKKVDEKFKWNNILCNVVTKLTDEQQAAYLNQVHVKGKNQWSAYAKANVTYVMKYEKGWSDKKIAKLFQISPGTVFLRVKTIKTMKDEGDTNLSHFSYYDVLVRQREISKAISGNEELKKKVCNDIKKVADGNNENNSFTAQALRNHLPSVIRKPKILRKFISGELDLEQAYQQARPSDLAKKVKEAKGLLTSIERNAVSALEQREFKDFKYSINQLKKEVNRINDIAKKYENK